MIAENEVLSSRYTESQTVIMTTHSLKTFLEAGKLIQHVRCLPSLYTTYPQALSSGVNPDLSQELP